MSDGVSERVSLMLDVSHTVRSCCSLGWYAVFCYTASQDASSSKSSKVSLCRFGSHKL